MLELLLRLQWLRYDFPEPVELTGYAIKSRNANEAPAIFTLQGSNDGQNWTAIEQRPGLDGGQDVVRWPPEAKQPCVLDIVVGGRSIPAFQY